MADLVVTIRLGTNIDDVADRLAKAGLSVNAKLAAIGVVTGSAETAAISNLRSIEGVEDVSEDAPVQLPPPGSPLT
jgi:hypothetical protein